MGLAEARRAARRARRTYWKNELVRLPDNAYVVRGGTCQFRDLLRSAEMTRETIGEWAVSAASGVDTPWESLAQAHAHGTVSATTAGRLRSAGFEVMLTGKPPHCTVYLGADPADNESVIERLRAAFDAPVPNPRRKTK